MTEEVMLNKAGILIPWKLFVGAVVAMLGFYVATQIAPLRGEMMAMQAELANQKVQIATLQSQIFAMDNRTKRPTQ